VYNGGASKEAVKMNIKKLAEKLDKLADDMQDMFNEMSDEQYSEADALSLATLQSELYGWAQEIRDA